MKRIIQITLIAIINMAVVSCGGSKKDGDAAVNDKKAKLEKLKKEQEKSSLEILKLQEELSKIDTTSSNPAKIKLVAIAALVQQDFNHYIELQGRVDAENISYISPRGMGGQVKAVLIRQGESVKKGQLLLKLDDAIQRQQVVAAKQQLGAIQSQLVLARSVYQRQQNLWNQGIGTEVQLLTSKTNVTTLESQQQQINEQVKLAQEQLSTASVYSDVSGIADIVNIRVGEIFQGVTASGPQIKIINTSNLKVVSNIPENYLGAVQKGTQVIVFLPDANKTINTTVSFTGASIDIINRGFVVEAKLPADRALKPNQLATMKIRDYKALNAITVPLNILQNDEKGKFVMVAVEEKGKLFARKRMVNIGMLNGDQLEIKTGLNAGDKVIIEGFATLYEGQQLKTSN